ncbi:MAG: dihydrofolate reductase [Nitratireductor sp.]|nr:dihydrofolate reductase [Nitratireductor sp.]
MIAAIAAIGRNWQLGLHGRLPWPQDSADMDWFIQHTKERVLLCGPKTFESIAHLDGSHDRMVINIATDDRWMGLDDAMIVGGASTYRHFAPHIEQLYLSQIDYDGPADCLFPVEAFRPDQLRNVIWRK